MRSRGLLIIGGIVVALIAVWVGLNFVNRGNGDLSPNNKVFDAGGAAAGLVPEEERAAYIEKYVTTSSVSVKGDLVPDGEGGQKRVAGLLRVRGYVKNNGDRPVQPVRILITTMSDAGAVLGSYLEDVTPGEPLRPGQDREFKFTIPDKKEFNGKFEQKLR